MIREYLDRPPAGWHVVAVMRAESRTRNWVALIIDMPLDEYRTGARPARNAWVRIPGKHRHAAAAQAALEAMAATRH